MGSMLSRGILGRRVIDNGKRAGTFRPMRTITKTSVFAVLPSLFLLLAGDVAIRYWYGEPSWKFAGDVIARRTAQERVVFRKPLARADAVTGYSCVPGEHRISVVKGLARIDFEATIGADGYRITSRNLSAPAQRPQIWISGCSYTWGLGVDDHETYSWLVQAALPGFRVRNLGGNGFGNIQALLQLQAAIANKEELPRVAVVVYNDFDLPRNVAAPSYLAMMNGSGSAFAHGNVAVAQASFDGDGPLRVNFAPLFHGPPRAAQDPTPAYETAVTEKILDGIADICTRNAIIPVFAIQSQPEGDPIYEYARKKGWVLANLWVDLDERAGTRYRLMPVDAHPNRFAHRVYAEKLLQTLRGFRF